jgi:hypothetical protein
MLSRYRESKSPIGLLPYVARLFALAGPLYNIFVWIATCFFFSAGTDVLHGKIS